MVKSNRMEFDLNRESIDEIIFSMEDQSSRYVWDAHENRCVPVSAETSGDDTGRYYSIPLWDSFSGYRMMDRFVARLRNPVAREKLRTALAGGHGVFRNFKNILHDHPEVEKLWFHFKDREMRGIVLDWYNNLREFWGLEHIGSEPDETDDILMDDFVFRGCASDDLDRVQLLIDSAAQDLAGLLPGSDADLPEVCPPALGAALLNLCRRLAADDPADGQHCVLAEPVDGETAGCVLSAVLGADASAAHISALTVLPEYRGLGVGTRLLEMTVSWWAEHGCTWLIFDSPVVPQLFLPVLRRMGFRQIGQVSVLHLGSDAGIEQIDYL